MRLPCELCEGNHTLRRCPFLDEAKRALEDQPVAPLLLPPGYQKLAPSPSLVENTAAPLIGPAEVSVTESEPTESGADESPRSKRQLTRFSLQKFHLQIPQSLRIHLQMTPLPERVRMTPSRLFSSTPILMNIRAMCPLLYHRKELRQDHIRPYIRSHHQATWLCPLIGTN